MYRPTRAAPLGRISTLTGGKGRRTDPADTPQAETESPGGRMKNRVRALRVALPLTTHSP
eukprot:1175354-Prorocentrum_minimum.AAC.2